MDPLNQYVTHLDKLEGVIWLDGEFVDWQQCKVHIATHALHYGGGVFEGIRIYGHKPFKLDAHNQRLIKSAELLGYKIPYTLSFLNAATEDVVKRQNLKSGYIRVLAWRGSEELQISGSSCAIHVAIIAWDPFTGKSKSKEAGVRLEVAKWRKPSPLSVPVQSKAAGLYMMATAIQSDARQRGFDDALVLDIDGNIAEATTSNFFMIKDGILYTPIPDCFLDGITRQVVLEIANDLGIITMIKKLTIKDLTGASGAFLTGTTCEILTVKSITDGDFGEVYNFHAESMIESIRTEYFLRTTL